MLRVCGKSQSLLRNLVCFRSFSVKETQFEKLSHVDHILKRPGMYVGSPELDSSDMWLYNESTNKMEKRTVDMSPALLKIFDEIVVNAADNQQRDKKMTKIEVNVKYVKKNKSLQISVKNDGLGIPVKIHEKENVYIPEMIFGQLMTGSNFNDTEKRIVGGNHGHGAKMTNIFSKKFCVETYDKTRNKLYEQEWAQNMSIVNPAKVTDVALPGSYTKISFEPDLMQLGFKNSAKLLTDGVTVENAIALFRRRAIDVAAIVAPVKISFNGKVIPVESFLDYVKLFSDKGLSDTPPVNPTAESDIEGVESVEGAEPFKDALESIFHCKAGPRWEVALKRSPSREFESMSFVNGVWTSRGGSHVKYISDQVVSALDVELKKRLKKLKLTSKLTSSHIRNKIMLFVSCRVENPMFDGQSKEVLNTKPVDFGSECILKPSFLKDFVENSGVVESLAADVEEVEKRKLNASGGTGKNSKTINLKLQDAKFAGVKNKSKDCTLILTEGDSAMPLAQAGVEVVGRDYFGVMPLRGKVLNVRAATNAQVIENKEIQSLVAALGLDYKKTYETLEGQGLRYGKVLIMTDQDKDGSHIKGLLINFFHRFWPNLVTNEGFLQHFITPLVKATNRKTEKEKWFYSMKQYTDWVSLLSEVDKLKYKHKYYKGLGTSGKDEGKEYFQQLDKHRKTFFSGGNHDDAIDLAFNKNRAEDRKLWLNYVFDPTASIDLVAPRVSYEDFIDKELIQFSVADNERSVPNVMDGLKPSQRKVLFGCFKKNLSEEMRVDALSGYISENTGYHHGQSSLQGTIVNMAQDFVGSNNVNYLLPSGNFGTRAKHDNASAARYINTKLSKIARALFPVDDDCLLTYHVEDGEQVEPHYFIPVIPTLLLNGSQGIGTGWSTNIPQYNILEVIERVEAKVRGDPAIQKSLVPWFKDFKGTIVESKVSRTNTVSPCSTSFTATGKVTRTSPTTIEIEEVPPQTWIDDYHDKVLVPLIDKTKIAIEHEQNGYLFKLTGTKEEIDAIDDSALKLEANISTTNMHAFDPQRRIKRYDTAEDILNEHFEVRLNAYNERKVRNERNHQADEMLARSKSSFIADILRGDIIVLPQGSKVVKEELIVEQLRQRGFVTLADIEKVRNPQQASPTTISSTAGDEASNNGEDLEDVEDDATDPSSSSSSSGGGGKKRLSHEYRYLLDMPIHSLTEARAATLDRQATEAANKYLASQNELPRDLWLADLAALRARYLELEQTKLDKKKISDEKFKKAPSSSSKKTKGKKTK